MLHLLSICALISLVVGHGMVLQPVQRSSLWRYDSTAPINYNDNELFCGGFFTQWYQNNGLCGLCGDNYALPRPRPNEIGGFYGSGKIVASYIQGSQIQVSVLITANHLGYFYFNLCNLDSSSENEACFSKYPLKLTNGATRYTISSATGYHNVNLQLPAGVKCNHCVLQWTYNTGNSWGVCENGSGAMGCGAQENFRTCSDISIR